ncbi:uncharacterized protein LOC135278299 [Passer domesticus]|uniref:uncharacterized protein LOC135278299 n=1 Tax=Passer domesticus TaxID=48849 RepID=UPI0030FE414E
MTKNLRSEDGERRHLALRGLVVLGKNPLMAEKMWSLTESLVELLEENDSDVIRMTILLLRYLFLDNGTPIPSSLALQLAEALLPLFDRDDSQVQLSSMMVFQEMLELLTEDGKHALKSPVHHSLLPLYFHCHDENQIVAECSRETLLCAAKFLKRRDIKKLVKEEKLWKFSKCLLAEDTSRAAEQLPLEEMASDISLGVGSLAIETLCILRSAERAPISRFQRLQDQLRRVWKARPRLSHLRRLSCWSSVEN